MRKDSGVRSRQALLFSVQNHLVARGFFRGLTLLEVILALAILAGSVAVLGELVRSGLLSATDARDYTRAGLHAESIMSQVVAGAIPTGSTSNVPIEGDPNYVYSMITEEVDQAGLLSISVTVTRSQTSQRKPVEFTLVRWMVDPQMEMDLAAQAQANAQANAEAKSQSEQNSTSGSSSNRSGTSQQGGPQ